MYHFISNDPLTSLSFQYITRHIYQVSAKSISLKQAVLIAAICEFLGAMLLGASVTSTIRKVRKKCLISIISRYCSSYCSNHVVIFLCIYDIYFVCVSHSNPPTYHRA